jgi:hypothetical protein
MRRINNPLKTNTRRYTHKAKTVTSILNNRSVESLRKFLESDYDFEVGYVPPGYEHRPDKISSVFYGTPDNWWLLLMANSITDPNEGFRINQKIKIPKLQ